ncbi:hypothetical protein ACFFIX_11755 [Metabacillus herbersteinensis]|uniref:HPr family phosphocarrier protein n=2 Tax=Metabacillus herbersteinensis TaxID=283816 RepID=A0ABV6GGQ8_9BACI
MSELMTTDLHIQKQLRMEQVLKINQLAKSYSGQIYLLTNKKHIVDASKLPSLMAFLLTLKNGQPLKIIIDGYNPASMMQELEEIYAIRSVRFSKQVWHPAVKVKI